MTDAKALDDPLQTAAARESGMTGDAPGLAVGLGTAGLVLTVMAYLAPLAGAAGFVTLVIGYGNGLGAPLIFPLAGVILLLFAVGYTAMVRRLPRPGAFYAYISAGLGKRLGLGAGTATAAYYLLSGIGGYVFGGVATRNLMKNQLGVDLPWWTYVIGLMVIVAFCSYRGVDFNARVVGTIVCVEILIVGAFNIVTLVRGGPTGHPTAPLTWHAFTGGPIAVAVLYAISVFAGFESTAIYREEVRTPTRTIPRATYILIIAISLFYGLTSWSLIAALGTGKAVSATAADPTGAFTSAIGYALGHTIAEAVSALLVTSVLASQITVANATTRYLYSFGVDRVLPASLARIHPRHGSPHRAAIVNTAIAATAILLLILGGTDPTVIYIVFSAVLVFALEALMLLVSLAVLVYFRRNPHTWEPAWKVVAAPLASAACFAWLLYFTASRPDLLLGTGTTTILTPILTAVIALAFVGGLGYASWQAVRHPTDYQRIGRDTTN